MTNLVAREAVGPVHGDGYQGKAAEAALHHVGDRVTRFAEIMHVTVCFQQKLVLLP
jgi:hypothetical protein